MLRRKPKQTLEHGAWRRAHGSRCGQRKLELLDVRLDAQHASAWVKVEQHALARFVIGQQAAAEFAHAIGPRQLTERMHQQLAYPLALPGVNYRDRGFGHFGTVIEHDVARDAQWNLAAIFGVRKCTDRLVPHSVELSQVTQVRFRQLLFAHQKSSVTRVFTKRREPLREEIPVLGTYGAQPNVGSIVELFVDPLKSAHHKAFSVGEASMHKQPTRKPYARRCKRLREHG